MTVFIGCDPDTNATGIAMATAGGWRLYSAAVAAGDMETRLGHMRARLSEVISTIYIPCGEVAVAAIEWPMVYPRLKARPNDILAVATVAGIAMALLPPTARMYIPRPQAWKGTVPKEIAQKRYLAEAGLSLDGPEFAGIPSKYKTHVVDAIGLALWARRTFPR